MVRTSDLAARNSKLFLLSRCRCRLWLLFLFIQHLVQHISPSLFLWWLLLIVIRLVPVGGRWRSCWLWLSLRLLLSRLLWGLLVGLLVRVVLVTQARAQNSAGKVPGFPRSGQQVLQLDAGDGLKIGDDTRVRKRSRHEHGHDQFTIAIGQRRGHISTDPVDAANGIRHGFGEHGGYIHVHRIIHHAHCTMPRTYGAHNQWLQVIRLSEAVSHVEGCRHLRHVGEGMV